MILLKYQSLLLFTGIATLCLSNEDNTHSGTIRALADDARQRKQQGNSQCGINRDSMKCIRFSKIVEGRSETSDVPRYPLGRNQFPIKSKFQENLKKTDAVSVGFDIPRTQESAAGWTRSDLVKWAGGDPSYPNCDGQNFEFWNELREVIEVQKMARAGGNACEVMPLPTIWKGFTFKEAAEAVRNEFPGFWQGVYSTEVLKGEYGEFSFDEKVLPGYTGDRFVLGAVMMSDMTSWAVGVVSDYNFYLKWQFGRARPEEVLYKVLSSVLRNNDVNCAPGDIPQDVVDDIKKHFSDIESIPTNFEQDILEATKFTQYKNEGSPKHPSYPAMHSAASSAAFWVATVIDLDSPGAANIIEEAMLTDYAVAYARTVAAVHYPGDNVAGLRLGQEVLSRLLPDQLSGKNGSRYGGNENAIIKKINRIKDEKWVNWDSFFERNGIVNNIGITEDRYKSIAANFNNACTSS